MLFFTWSFAAFFLIFFPIYLFANRHVLARNLLLLAAAYFFYGWWDVRFLGLMAFTTSLDYLTARGAAGFKVTLRQSSRSAMFMGGMSGAAALLSGTNFAQIILPAAAAIMIFFGLSFFNNKINDVQKRRKVWILSSLILNLTVLGFFKYFNFFGNSLQELVGLAGYQLGFVERNIILPIAISFITFQSLGRTIDCYRNDVKPGDSFLEYATFISYFPQLLAGPIERANSFLPQFREKRPVSFALIRSGSLLFLLGLFKKLVIADNMAIIANPIFANPGDYNSSMLLLGALAFTMQIYGDFSGYTDMARGLARIMGFELRMNFNLPYFSRTPSEFWQRWHISLSQWLRDYLYISMGGNRKGNARTYQNLMVTMLLGGLWHGASWTYVIWGFLHGGIQVVYRFFGLDRIIGASRGVVATAVVSVAAWLAFFPFLVVTWILFRAESLAGAVSFIGAMADYQSLFSGNWSQWLWLVALLLPIEIYQRFLQDKTPFGNWPFIAKYSAAVILLLIIITQVAPTSEEFIYFDF